MSSGTGSEEQSLPLMAVFSPPPIPDCVQQSLSALKTVPNAKYEMMVSLAATSQAFDPPSARGVALINLRNKEDLLGTLNFIGKHQVKMRKGLLKVIVVEQMKDRKVTEILQSKGVKEIVGAKLPARSLLHKIQTSLQVVERTWARANESNDPKAGGFGTGKKPAGAAAAASGQNRVDWVPALLLAADFWMVEGKPGAKRVLGRWMIEVTGPGPSAGNWVPIRLAPDAPAGTTWEWKGKASEAGSFLTPEGRWIFYGREPNFDWKTLKWRMVSDRPRLAYYENKATKPLVYRFDTDPMGAVTIAENSPQAKARLPEIQKSLEAEVRLKGMENKSKSDEGDDDLSLDPTGDSKSPGGSKNRRVDAEASGSESTEASWGETSNASGNSSGSGDQESSSDDGGWTASWSDVAKSGSSESADGGASSDDGAWTASGLDTSKEEKPADWNDQVKKDEEKNPAEWGDHVKKDEDNAAAWGDHVKKDEDNAAAWGDHVKKDEDNAAAWGDNVSEDPEAKDWGGDAKRDNKFNGGRGIGQGEKSADNQGYKGDDAVAFAKDAGDDSDYGGDAKRDSVFNSGGGLGQGEKSAENQGYAFEKDEVGLSADEVAAKRKEKQAAREAAEAKERGAEMREALGEVDERWATGEEAFKSVKLVARIKDALKKDTAEWSDATFLEQRDTLIWIEIRTGALTEESIGLLELITVELDGTESSIQVPARVVTLEDAGEGATIFQGMMQPTGAERLKKIVERFEGRQSELLNFFHEAKGEATGTE